MNDGRDRIRHPGPAGSPRIHVAPGRARDVVLRLPAGAPLMAAVAAEMDRLGCDSAVADLGGLRIGPYSYVGPDRSPDDKHAAWYSATHRGAAATLAAATAVIGTREGAWWLHCHAHWDAETTAPKAGHLLPDQVTIAEDAEIPALAFEGGRYNVVHDAETNFPFFRAQPTQSEPRPAAPPNAVIATIAPHEDLHAAIARIADRTGLKNARLMGIGSLIGAEFSDAPAMDSPISEALILRGATWSAADGARLPMLCVDPAGDIFSGDLVPGGAPVCVTFEVILTA